jgi:CheY-like chemotaxis protein
LGLAIVRHLIELHGGTVYADSPGEGFGSTFTIQLPLAVVPESPKRQKRRTENFLPIEKTGALVTSVPSLKDVQVLVVDDDRDTLQVLKVMLEENQAKVQIAGSAAEALELLEWYEPDIMVFDLAMPDEDGFSLIRRIRELEAKTGRQAPAVALTAHVRVEDRARALSAGFSMFVPKPVEADELITAIANLVVSEITSVM